MTGRQMLRELFLTRVSICKVLFLWLGVVMFLFVLSEWVLLSSAIVATMSLGTIVTLMSTVAFDFINPQSNVLFWYYASSSVLITVYLRVVVALFAAKGMVSLSSVTLSTLGMMGVSVGVFCISCGVIGGYILLSIITAITAGVFLGHEQQFLLGFGNFLLLASIAVAGKALYVMKR